MPSDQTPRCRHTHPSGAQCKAHPQTGSQYCFFHDPALHKKRKAASRAGGVGNRKPAQPVHPPDNPLQTASQMADLLRQTMNRVSRDEINVRAAIALGYLTTVLLQVIKQDARDEQAARLSAAAEAALQTLLSDPTPTAEPASPQQERAKLAARLFADDNSLSENVKREVVGKRNHEQHHAPQPDDLQHGDVKPHDQKTNDHFALKPFSPPPQPDKKPDEKTKPVPPPAKPDEASERQPVPNDASPEPLASAKAGLHNHQGQADAPSPSKPASPPAKPDEVPDKVKDEVRQEVRPDQPFSGIPGLSPHHTNYMNFIALPGTALWKRQRYNQAFLTETAEMQGQVVPRRRR
jgi:hypothetical protein